MFLHSLRHGQLAHMQLSYDWCLQSHEFDVHLIVRAMKLNLDKEALVCGQAQEDGVIPFHALMVSFF